MSRARGERSASLFQCSHGLCEYLNVWIGAETSLSRKRSPTDPSVGAQPPLELGSGINKSSATQW